MVEILAEAPPPSDPDRLQRIVERWLGELGIDERGVTIVLVDAAAIRERNRRDRGVDAPTDVLSYPTFEPDGLPMPAVDHLGDVFVAVDVAAAQAEEHGHTAAEELLALVAHGITHLRGFDHGPEGESEDSWLPFRRAERRIVELARGAA